LLRSWGYDVVSAHDVAAVNLTDEEQLIRAVADGRAIVSYNFHDFKSLADPGTFKAAGTRGSCFPTVSTATIASRLW
jgi:hypothetical protein